MKYTLFGLETSCTPPFQCWHHFSTFLIARSCVFLALFGLYANCNLHIHERIRNVAPQDQIQHHGWSVYKSWLNSFVFSKVSSFTVLCVWLPIIKPFDITTVFLGKVWGFNFVYFLVLLWLWVHVVTSQTAPSWVNDKHWTFLTIWLNSTLTPHFMSE